MKYKLQIVWSLAIINIILMTIILSTDSPYRIYILIAQLIVLAVQLFINFFTGDIY